MLRVAILVIPICLTWAQAIFDTIDEDAMSTDAHEAAEQGSCLIQGIRGSPLRSGAPMALVQPARKNGSGSNDSTTSPAPLDATEKKAGNRTRSENSTDAAKDVGTVKRKPQFYPAKESQPTPTPVKSTGHTLIPGITNKSGCLTSRDQTLAKDNAWFPWMVSLPRVPCKFGIDPYDEGWHCMGIGDPKYGSYGWCYTRDDMTEWGLCGENCPLAGPLAKLGNKMEGLREELHKGDHLLLDVLKGLAEGHKEKPKGEAKSREKASPKAAENHKEEEKPADKPKEQKAVDKSQEKAKSGKKGKEEKPADKPKDEKSLVAEPVAGTRKEKSLVAEQVAALFDGGQKQPKPETSKLQERGVQSQGSQGSAISPSAQSNRSKANVHQPSLVQNHTSPQARPDKKADRAMPHHPTLVDLLRGLVH